MADKKPDAFPPAVEPDDEDEEPQSTLPPEQAEREAQRAIEEIEEEIDQERPSKRAAPPPPHHEGSEKGFVDRAWDTQYRMQANLKRAGAGRYSRVLKMARKPEPEEYHKALQITALGIAIIGFVGFLIYLFTGWVWDLLNVR